ncbi:caspase family protein [Allomesorhizobium alhagi]|uniref:Peptidase C14 caspase catalytic subunit p20 n=1 Tax=Mesorhizobium alhagi CCNWXJ12-2 TaxID=1107882 RepID=H0HQ91_9HYPH|nr:caspase family protein [Mesorhizobium alhagi]EHK57117.1 peptidase C14 caspase catalytic subunit p20 [Mesorhizobium alhagi CCNWXJ12-2]
MVRNATGRHVALVIGNGRYGPYGNLPNAVRDCKIVADKLKKLGFEVDRETIVANATASAMQEAVEALLRKLNSGVPAETALIYFAGHGFQERGRNYLLGVPDDEGRVGALSLQRMLSSLRTEGERPLCDRRLIFLDACRDSFESERLADTFQRTRKAIAGIRPEIIPGLVDADYGSETFLAFSAQPGKRALDGIADAPNSPYAAALVENLDVADLSLPVLMGRVHRDVVKATDERQKPQTHSTLTRPFYFNPQRLLFLAVNAMAMLAVTISLGVLGSAVFQFGVDLANGSEQAGFLSLAIGLFVVSVACLVYGVARAVSYTRGLTAPDDKDKAREIGAARAGHGAIGGILGGIIAAPLIALPYWWNWRVNVLHPELWVGECTARLWYDPNTPELCPRLSDLLVEISLATVVISTPLGFLSVLLANHLMGAKAAERHLARMMLIGGTAGGTLAGLLVGPVITAYFGAQDRPFVEPTAYFAISAVCVAIVAFSIDSYAIEFVSRARLIRSVVGAFVGMAVAGMALGGAVGLLYAIGFIQATLSWASDGFWNEALPYSQRLFYLIVAGLPYGMVFGAALGLMISVTRLMSDRTIVAERAVIWKRRALRYYFKWRRIVLLSLKYTYRPQEENDMSDDTPAPLDSRQGFSGQAVPLWMLTFDKSGKCTSPKHRDAVVRAIEDGDYTDTIVYCHGWNTDYAHAKRLYTRFLDGVGGMATERGIKRKVMFIGIAWPSAALVWRSEQTPDLAADQPEEPDDVAFLTEDMAPGRADALRVLVRGRENLDAKEVSALAALLGPELAATSEDEDPEAKYPLSERDLALILRVAGRDGATDGAPDTGFTGGASPGSAANGPNAAGGLSDLFGLRKVLRVATVLKMKDRAGVVGAGLSDTLERILTQTETRLHLVGHSYGTKVVMTGLCRAAPSRKVRSALLLQPAVNLLAFAPEVAGRPGGFRAALTHTERPILVTHSRDDLPLRRLFHLAARRRKDLGEVMTAPDISRFAAMGGYGPRNLAGGESVSFEIPNPFEDYPDPGGASIVSLDASGKIEGHSDVTKPITFWAMLGNLGV